VYDEDRSDGGASRNNTKGFGADQSAKSSHYNKSQTQQQDQSSKNKPANDGSRKNQQSNKGDYSIDESRYRQQPSNLDERSRGIYNKGSDDQSSGTYEQKRPSVDAGRQSSGERIRRSKNDRQSQRTSNPTSIGHVEI
jgi:hypothetical protein